MFGHDDFSKVKKLWDDFWAGENKRPLYAVAIPKNGAEAMPYPPYLMGFGGNYQAVADMLARWVESLEFFGAAIPTYSLSFGADDFAAFCGADLKMGQNGDTSWSVHKLASLKGAKIRFDKNSPWWQRLAEFRHVLKKTLGDSVLLTAPTLSAGLDGIAGLYGAENLLFDMIGDPEAVCDAVSQINAAYDDAVKACGELFEYEKYGSATRHGMYSSGIAGVPQCDISCMISPEMFEKFAIPCIEHEIGALDAAEYHLDGPDALKHLERLSQIPKLRVVQWVPGAGEAESQDWLGLYKRIVSLGKGLILGGDINGVANLQSELESKDIFFSVYGIASRSEAEDFLAEKEYRE